MGKYSTYCTITLSILEKYFYCGNKIWMSLSTEKNKFISSQQEKSIFKLLGKVFILQNNLFPLFTSLVFFSSKGQLF